MGCGPFPLLSCPHHLGLYLLPDVLRALRGAAVGLGDVAHGEGHEAQRVVAVGHSGTALVGGEVRKGPCSPDPPC